MSAAGTQCGSRVRPLGVYLPRPDIAASVVAPHYADPLLEDSSESAVGGPLGFLNAVRAEIDSPRTDEVARRSLLADTAIRLRELLEGGTYEHHASPIFLACRLEAGGHAQTGIIADVSLDGYREGYVKVHESTRHDQEDRLLEYMSAVRASFLPVFLTHRPSESVDEVVAAATTADPTIDIETGDGLRITVWAIAAPELVASIEASLAGLDALYVADGHHRAAAAARYALRCAEENPDHTGVEAYTHIAAVLFSSDQLSIQPYDRCVELAEHTPEEVLARIGQEFELEPLDGRPDVAGAGEYLMRIAERWYRVRPPRRLLSQLGVAGLDVSVLHDHVIAPILGVEDARTDPRLQFIPGADGRSELERLCRGAGTVSFAVHPTSVDELMEVADRGETMPPKSTFFAPKLRSGLVVRLL